MKTQAKSGMRQCKQYLLTIRVNDVKLYGDTYLHDFYFFFEDQIIKLLNISWCYWASYFCH